MLMFLAAAAQSSETTSLLPPSRSRPVEESQDIHEPLEEEESEVIHTDDDDEEEEEDEEDATPATTDAATHDEGPVAQLTRRLRCLFSTITWPIVPLGTILSFSLLWVLYCGFVLDLRKSCSRPLHWYAVGSLLFVAYAPHHPQVRNYIFHYSLERDGPQRPMAVRMYDQLFHTLCILYVYGGVTLLETCLEDGASAEQDDNDGGDVVYHKDDAQPSSSSDGAAAAAASTADNTCSETCPNLYQALTIYVTILELFTFAIILPLLFLPCVYLWIIRRASAEAEAFSQFQDRLEEEEALLHNGGITTQEIMDSLEKVKLVRLVRNDDDDDHDSDVVVLPLSPSSSSTTTLTEDVMAEQSDNDATCNDNVPRECCICMNEFYVCRPCDIETGELRPTPERASASNNDDDDIIVRTKCGHLFHGSCLAGWLGGRWEPSNETNGAEERSDRQRRRARRTGCPLCREDLKPRRDS